MNNDIKEGNRIYGLFFGALLFLEGIPLLFYFISKFLDELFTISLCFQFPLNYLIGVPLSVFGFLWSFEANRMLFKVGKGGPIPHEKLQTQHLVIRGVYKYSRNPMIFGYILMLNGLGIIFNSVFYLVLANLIILPGVILFIKFKEEKGLIKRFGLEYIQYKKRTSFIIPWFPKKVQENNDE